MFQIQDEVLSRFQFAGLKLKRKKCVFADHEVEYLGFKFTDQGLHATTTKIEAIMQIKPPDTTKKLFSFLCSINYYRSLIPNYGRITAKLYKMCEDIPQICEECELFLTKDNECVNNCPLFTFGNKVTKLCEGIYNLI